MAALPAGFILKHFTKEELKQGKPYFRILWISSIIAGILIFFLNIDETIKFSAGFSLIFISIISFISWKK